MIETIIKNNIGKYEIDFFSSLIKNFDEANQYKLFNILVETENEYLTEIMKKYPDGLSYDGYIPQFSQVLDIIEYLHYFINSPLSFIEFSELVNSNKNRNSHMKFGELRVKLMYSIGLLEKKEYTHINKYSISKYGALFNNLNTESKINYLKNAMSFIGIIRYIISNNYEGFKDVKVNMSSSTISRRSSDVSNILSFIKNNSREEMIMDNKIDFKKQIADDIDFIKNNVSNGKMRDDDYYFNHWILIKLFNFDEQIAGEYVIDGSDKAIDSYVWFEHTKELYLIQAKYYSEGSSMDSKYIFDEFLNKPLGYLNNGAYSHCKKLQNIFTKYKDDSEFTVRMQLYITTKEQVNFNGKFNSFMLPDYGIAIINEIFWIDDIRMKYFDERTTETKKMEFQLQTFSDKTILDIKNDGKKLNLKLDSMYILTPIFQLYKLLDYANKKAYSLFSENIRDYIGNKGVNAAIYETLKDKEDRVNFFYYNNGVTILCKEARPASYSDRMDSKDIVIKNPQVVNGAQTVNTIYNVIQKDMNESQHTKDEFANTFVMLKLLVIPDNNAEDENYTKLSDDIVRYNNSQNAISERDFAANKEIFTNLRNDLVSYGMLVFVKQSDKNSFKSSYNTLDLNNKFFVMFGIDYTVRNNHEINLIDMLQVLFAFSKDAYIAKNKKQTLLKPPTNSGVTGQDNYGYLVEYIKSAVLTKEHIVKLILFYKKARFNLSQEEKNDEGKGQYSTLHMLDFLRRYIEKSNYKSNYAAFLNEKMNTKDDVKNIYDEIKIITTLYISNMKQTTGDDFNQITKSRIDVDQFNHAYNTAQALKK